MIGGPAQQSDRATEKAARRAQNKAAFAAGVVLARWACGQRPSGRARTVISPEQVQEATAQARAQHANRAAANRAAWAGGLGVPRWDEGQRPGRSGPRTGPGPVPDGAPERAANRANRAAANRAAWQAQQTAAANQRAAAREQARIERRTSDRERAAAWHEARRMDTELAGSEHDVWAGN